MQYGKFSKEGKEFIIHDVETPSPWINYIYNKNYFGTISNNGGGISYHKSPLYGRVTRYRINDLPHDRPGKYIYIKDNDSGEIWSLTWQPVGKDKSSYKIYHGFGYTKSEANVNEIESAVTYFVPQDDDLEIWKSIIKNNSSKKRNLSVYGYVEFALGHAIIDLINQCDDQHFNRVKFDEKLNSIFATKTYWVTGSNGTQHQENKEWNNWAFFSCNKKISSYETLREKFIGLYRNENTPLGLEKNELSSTDTDYGNAVGALKIDIQLDPGESTDVIFNLGVIDKEEFIYKKNLATKYHNNDLVNDAFKKLNDEWDRYFSHTKIQTPDEEVNIFMNYWTPYQAKVAFDVGRVISFYYWGIGRGFGFRDTSQDTIAVTISNPEKAKERIHLLARQMFIDGSVYHHFYNDGQGEKTGHCDDPLWFLLAVTDYIKETGDFEILDKREPFVDGDSDKILNHMFSVVSFVKNNLGKHGLPIFGRGDWNDTLDYIGGDDGGESVWGGMFYVAMLNHFIDLLEIIKNDRIRFVTEIRDQISDSINEHCWDGNWFIRAFGQGDKKIGSSESEAAKIFLNSQSWAVLANVSNKERLIKALDSVKDELDSEYGPKICAPAFREIDENVGLVTRCVPGKKENGAIFCHPTTWLIQAECMMKRGNKAFEYYKKMLPSNHDHDIFIAEPYVYSQYITSDEHEYPGKASHTWQTGSAAWMFRNSIDYILGIRASYNGLIVDPVIPSEWKEFKFERIFRGTKYKIHVKNPDGKESGVRNIFIDDDEIDSAILPEFDKDEVDVVVLM